MPDAKIQDARRKVSRDMIRVMPTIRQGQEAMKQGSKQSERKAIELHPGAQVLAGQPVAAAKNEQK
jgi:hypothetical protein